MVALYIATPSVLGETPDSSTVMSFMLRFTACEPSTGDSTVCQKLSPEANMSFYSSAWSFAMVFAGAVMLSPARFEC